MWIRSPGGESPQISAQKTPHKKIKKKKGAKKRLALSVNDEDRKRESVCVCPDSSFTLDKIFDVERISSRP
jgi:hypothetical protein